MKLVTILVSSLLTLASQLYAEPERFTRRSGESTLAISTSQMAGAQDGRTYLDTEGKPLPFSSEDEILAFLETAEIRVLEKIAKGINGAIKVELEQGDVLAHGVFRTVARSAIRERNHGAPAVRDHYLFEKAAYELSRRLGIDSIPATVVRRVDGRQGTLQLWIENAVGGTKLLLVEDRPTWQELLEERREMRLFDQLVHNFDRHLENVLVDADGSVWLIDHTRTFPAASRLQEPERLDYDQQFAERLRGLSPAEMRETVKPYLNAHELHALMARRKTLLRHLERLEESRSDMEVALARHHDD